MTANEPLQSARSDAGVLLPARPAELLGLAPCALIEVGVQPTGDRMITYFGRGACDIYGYAPQDVVGRDPALLSAGGPENDARRRASLEHDGHWTGRTTHRTQAGREIRVQLEGRSWRDARGHVQGYLLAVQDITEET